MLHLRLQHLKRDSETLSQLGGCPGDGGWCPKTSLTRLVCGVGNLRLGMSSTINFIRCKRAYADAQRETLHSTALLFAAVRPSIGYLKQVERDWAS